MLDSILCKKFCIVLNFIHETIEVILVCDEPRNIMVASFNTDTTNSSLIIRLIKGRSLKTAAAGMDNDWAQELVFMMGDGAKLPKCTL